MIRLIPKINTKFCFQDILYSFFSLFRKKKMGVESNIFYLNHARTALRVSLSALNLPEGSKIGVTAFNCLTVMNVILIAGYKPVFIDITDDLTIDLNDLKKKHENISAIIVTHLFGIPNNLKSIKEICNGIPIIEDCAHSFLSKSKEYVAGSLGDIVVYSIGQGKFPSIGNGGILHINNRKYIGNVNAIFSELDSNNIISEIKILFVQIFISLTHSPNLYYFTCWLKKRRKSNTQNNFTYKHIEKKMDYYVFSLYLKNKHKFPNYLLKQQENARKVLNSLSLNKTLKVCEIDVNNNNCFMLPFFSNKRIEFEKKYIRNGVEITSHFSKSIEWATNFGYKIGDCPNAERITDELLIIPVHYNLSDKSILKISKTLLLK